MAVLLYRRAVEKSLFIHCAEEIIDCTEKNSWVTFSNFKTWRMFYMPTGYKITFALPGLRKFKPLSGFRKLGQFLGPTSSDVFQNFTPVHRHTLIRCSTKTTI